MAQRHEKKSGSNRFAPYDKEGTSHYLPLVARSLLDLDPHRSLLVHKTPTFGRSAASPVGAGYRAAAAAAAARRRPPRPRRRLLLRARTITA